ncbi:hypothetical protein V8C44DRAFT_82006 [Trichoderma aethiopicum]
MHHLSCFFQAFQVPGYKTTRQAQPCMSAGMPVKHTASASSIASSNHASAGKANETHMLLLVASCVEECCCMRKPAPPAKTRGQLKVTLPSPKPVRPPAAKSATGPGLASPCRQGTDGCQVHIRSLKAASLLLLLLPTCRGAAAGAEDAAGTGTVTVTGTLVVVQSRRCNSVQIAIGQASAAM